MNHEIQAEQFLAYYAKLNGEGMEDVFARWADTKDFAPDSRRAIWYAVLDKGLPLGWEGVEAAS